VTPNKPEMLSAGEAIVANVAAQGVDTVFAIPGAQTYPLFDGLHRFGLRTVVPRHEQAAGYMAFGYAKSTGRTGVCCVVPGPGVLNASAALCTAMGACAPVVVLTGEVPSAYRGRGRGHLHELRDQAATLKSIIKDVLEPIDISSIPTIVREAFARASSGRAGPVAIQMSWDALAARGPNPGTLAPQAPVTPRIDADAIAQAAELIAAARRPMIMCGAGAQSASAEVLALAERLQAPVTAFRSGRGVVAEDHPLAAPPVTARLLWDETDLLIGIGSRLEMPYVRWRSGMQYASRPIGPKLLRIDIEADEMSRLVPDAGIVGDAAEACSALTRALEGMPLRCDSARAPAIAAARRRARGLLESLQPQAAYLDALRAVLPRNGFVVPELSQVGFATYTDLLPVYAPRTYVTEGHQGTLGFGFQTALGVKIANPSASVVSITGDGGFMFGLQELATAAEYGIGVVTLLFNNGAYGNVLRDQQQGSGRIIASTFRNPDFLALAASFGVHASRVSTPSAMARALATALTADAPHLIEVALDRGSEASPWPFIHMAAPPG
jgi:acetolactate synthase-1/2/3 large subunit